LHTLLLSALARPLKYHNYTLFDTANQGKKLPFSGRPHSVIIEPCIIKVIAWFGENPLKPLIIFADKKAYKRLRNGSIL